MKDENPSPLPPTTYTLTPSRIGESLRKLAEMRSQRDGNGRDQRQMANDR